MKKIVFLMIVSVLLSGCEMFKKYDYVVSNKSDYDVRVIVKIVSSNKLSKNVDDNFILKAGDKKIIKGYDNKCIELGSVGRYSLKKISITKYEVLNANAIAYTVYNKAAEAVILTETNNLFDTIELNPLDIKTIDIFANSDFYPLAKTKDNGLLLEVKKQEKKLIISF